jgi:hypothetical protein
MGVARVTVGKKEKINTPPMLYTLVDGPRQILAALGTYCQPTAVPTAPTAGGGEERGEISCSGPLVSGRGPEVQRFFFLCQRFSGVMSYPATAKNGRT